MQNRKSRSHTGAQWLRRHWILIAVVVIASVLVLARQPLLAADAQPRISQLPPGTVPPPTPKPEVPKPGNDDNNNDNNNNDNNNNDNNNDANNASPVEQTAPVVAVAAVTSTSGLTATVDVLTLNVRQGPGTTFPVIGKLAQGSTVSVEAVNTAGDWWQICCVAGTETRGWVSAALVVPGFAADQAAALPVSDSTVEAAPLGTATITTTTATTGTTTAPTLVAGAPTGTVAGVNLNVRSGPGTDSPVVAKLRANDVVSVVGRNAAGDWLYICCVGSPAGNGWVSAQFLTPSFAAGELEEVAGGSAAVPGDTTAAQGAAEGAADSTAAGAAGEVSGTSGLSLTISQQPPFAVQGREIALVYTVRNDTTSDLADVMLRSELPGPLTLVGATAAGGQVMSQDAPLVEVTFPVLVAGQSATATVRVRVANDVPNGTTFANFATVTGGAETASGGITIGMPPSLLPEFW